MVTSFTFTCEITLELEFIYKYEGQNFLRNMESFLLKTIKI